MSTKMTERQPTTIERAAKADAERRAARNAKWPPSVKSLRTKHPNGVLVRACFTIGGRTVTYDGVLDEQFLKLARATFDMSDVN